MIRKEERKWVVKLLFQHNFNELEIGNLEDILSEHQLNTEGFIYDSVFSILNNLSEIDRIIEPYLIKKIHNIEKAILRVSVNEFIIQKSVPNSVSINEAVEISKEFGNPDSYKLINGILSNINKEYSK